MNTKNNRRSQDTDERIIRTVYRLIQQEQRPLNRVTVREVCELARINRSTFYAHYLDVFDVVEQVEKQMSKQLTARFLDQLEQGASMEECFEGLFAFVGEYREFYAIYLQQMHQAGVIAVAWELLQDKLKDLSYREMGLRSQKELEYHGQFFLFGLTALIRRWLETGCEESPAEMVRILKEQYSSEFINLVRW